MNNTTIGLSSSNRLGQGGGQMRVIKGRDAIIIGAAMSIFPAYQLLKNRFKKHK